MNRIYTENLECGLKMNCRIKIILMLLTFLVGVKVSQAFDKKLVNLDGTKLSAKVLTVESGCVEQVFVDGKTRLKCVAQPYESVRFRLFAPEGVWNLKPYVNVTVDFENTGANEAFVRILIKDVKTQSESWYRPNLSHNAWIAVEESRSFDALLVRHKYSNPAVKPSYMDLFPKMHGLPHAQMLVWYGVDVTQISELLFELQPKAYAQTVYVDDVRATRRASPVLLEKNPDAFFPFIDQYGQYIHEDWPNKVMSDQDLIRQRKLEDQDLKKYPAPKSYNSFGGWNQGPTFKSTGHFRVKKVDGKWWFIDPVGKLFWSFGCTGIGYQPVRIALPGKAHFYAGLPDLDDPNFGDLYYRDRRKGFEPPDYKGVNAFLGGDYILRKKYGDSYREIFKSRSLRRARSWGLNTCGAWSSVVKEQPDNLKMPYTKELWVSGKQLKPIHKLVDPFEAKFSAWVERAVRGNEFAIDDPYCIGFFCNNEIHWGANPVKVVRDIINCDDSVAARRALGAFFAKRQVEVSNASEADLLAFYSHLLETYYKKCRDAVKKIAPNKLYLGSRLHDGALRKEAFSAAAKYCDVVSVNVYEKDVKAFNVRDERDQPFFTEDVPFLVGEFDFGALDRGKFFSGIGFAADQRNRGECMKYFIESALDNPRCVGAHWFHYYDSPTGSRYFDNENANCGIVSTSDTPYVELIDAFRSMAKRLYSYRNNGSTE